MDENQEETSALEDVAAGLAAGSEKKKAEIELTIRDCDALARKITAARQTLEKPEVVAFEEIKKATDEIRHLKVTFNEKKTAILRNLQNVSDMDFRDLINFHFNRLER
jgi:flagellin-specific chaperone FliS